jgi:hypothetical protein
MAEGHAKSQSIMKEGFVGWAIQNAELKDQNKALTDQLNQLQEQFAIVRQELQERKEQERLLQEKKDKWKTRRRFAKERTDYKRNLLFINSKFSKMEV